MHDSDAVKGENPVPHRLAHPSNLSIPAFGQYNPEPLGSKALHATWPSLASEDDDARGEPVQHRLIERAIDRHLVFAFVPELDTEYLVHNVAVVRQQNQAGRILIEAPDRENPFGMADFSDDVARNVGLTRGRNAHRLVILDVDPRLPPGNRLPVFGDHVLMADLVSMLRNDVVDGDASGFDQPIGFPPRADPVLGKEFVDANRIHAECRIYVLRSERCENARSVQGASGWAGELGQSARLGVRRVGRVRIGAQ